MSLDQKITSADIALWADRRVNLPSDRAKEFREQGNRLRDKLEAYIDANKDFNLVKILNSGSVEKGTALRAKSDMDLGVYVKHAAAPEKNPDLVAWLRDRLLEAYGDLINREQVTTDTASVRLTFVGSGVPVECVPILYDGDAENYGDLLLRTGERVRTSISKHVEFFRARKKKNPGTFAQFVRLLRYWRHQRDEEGRMPISAFAVELVAAHLVDGGLDPSNYPNAMQQFFSFVARGGLEKPILFSDNYAVSEALDDGRPMRIVDPVAARNNVTKDVSKSEVAKFVEAAMDGLDDVTIARTATTKEDAIRAWRNVFGPEFNV